jgi:hypothetical protein
MEILFFVVIDIRIFMVGCNEEFLSCPHKSKKTLSQVGASIIFILSNMEKINAS